MSCLKRKDFSLPASHKPETAKHFIVRVPDGYDFKRASARNNTHSWRRKVTYVKPHLFEDNAFEGPLLEPSSDLLMSSSELILALDRSSCSAPKHENQHFWVRLYQVGAKGELFRIAESKNPKTWVESLKCSAVKSMGFFLNQQNEKVEVSF